MHSTTTITPGMLVMLAAEWSDTELRAAAAVLAEMAQDRSGAVPVLEPEVRGGAKGDGVTEDAR